MYFNINRVSNWFYFIPREATLYKSIDVLKCFIVDLFTNWIKLLIFGCIYYIIQLSICIILLFPVLLSYIKSLYIIICIKKDYDNIDDNNIFCCKQFIDKSYEYFIKYSLL